MFDLQCNNFRENLLNTINQSQLPITVIYYTFKDILSELEKLYFKTLKEQQQEAKKQEAEKSKQKEEDKEEK